MDKSVTIAEEPETKISVEVNIYDLFKETKENKIKFQVGKSNYDREREIENQPAFILVKRDKRQCVVSVRESTGIPVSGYANTNRPNSGEPAIGAVVVLSEKPIGHLAVVLAYSDTKILISETNYISGWMTKRVISRDDPKIKGFIR